MLLDENDKQLQSNKVYSFESLSTSQKGEIENYIRALIQGYTQGNDKPFTVSDLVGGIFNDWSDTPLDYIYQYHYKNRTPQQAVEEAGKDMGRLFKFIMVNDKTRTYKMAGRVQRQFSTPTYEYIKK